MNDHLVLYAYSSASPARAVSRLPAGSLDSAIDEFARHRDARTPDRQPPFVRNTRAVALIDNGAEFLGPVKAILVDRDDAERGSTELKGRRFSNQAALDSHFTSSHFKKVVNAVKPLVGGGKPDITKLRQLTEKARLAPSVTLSAAAFW